MIKNPFIFNTDDEIISGTILCNKTSAVPPKFIFLHGAGASIKERVYGIAPSIIDVGTSILTIDFSGHGESTGELKKSSLEKRVNEAKHAINKFASKESLTICGVSMGGYVAIKLLELYKIDTLILFCPAIYDKKAYNIRFDAGFTEVIRTPESWRNTDVLPLLEEFTGKLLIVMGDKDEVIPREVIELIINNAKKANKKEVYIIPDCPHRINTWVLNHEKELIRLQQKVIEYLR